MFSQLKPPNYGLGILYIWKPKGSGRAARPRKPIESLLAIPLQVRKMILNQKPI
jgi:hypothetical protein